MKKLIKLYDNEDGATGVLVIFMLIVLVTLGAFAISSAAVNIRFAQRSIDWQDEYYTLNGQGETFLAKIDSALADASIGNADVYMQTAFANLQELADDYPEAFILPYENDGNIDEIYIELNLVSEESSNYNLLICLSVLPENRENAPRYTITSWKQWQEAQEEEQTQELWQGIIIE